MTRPPRGTVLIQRQSPPRIYGRTFQKGRITRMFGKKASEIFYINERSRTASEELAQVLKYCILQTHGNSVKWYFSVSAATESQRQSWPADRSPPDCLPGPWLLCLRHAGRSGSCPEFVGQAANDPPKASGRSGRRHRRLSRVPPTSGYITVGCGPIRPGPGAGKNLRKSVTSLSPESSTSPEALNSFSCRPPGFPQSFIWRKRLPRES